MTLPSHFLGVALMDEDHARLEDMLRRAADTADPDLSALLREVETETRAHFAREEDLMQAAAVPIFFCHVAQHNMIAAEFAHAHRLAEKGDLVGLRRFIGVDLVGLIEAHIDSVDRVTAGFLTGAFAADDLAGLRLDPSRS